MKKILLIAAGILMMAGSFAQGIWDDFETNRRAYYDFVHGTFRPYTTNPDGNGNSSLVVASYTRNAAETFDVLVLDGDEVAENLADYVAGTKQMSIDVWSPKAGITIQITLEDSSLAGPTNYPTGRHSIFLTTTTQDSAWETLTFNFDSRPDPNVPDNTVGRLVLLFNPNSNTDDTYYFDNLIGPAFANDPCDAVAASDSVLNDFECQQNSSVFFAHGLLNRVPNPDQSGINGSDYVGRYTRNPGEEFDVIRGTFPAGLTLSPDSNVFTMKVWDPNPNTQYRMAIFVDDAPSPPFEIAAVNDSTSEGSAWKQLAFRFGGDIFQGNTLSEWVLLFEPGDFTSDTYFFDDFALVTSGSLLNNEDVITNSSLSVYPNPSQGMTEFAYNLDKSSEVSLKVFDMAGKEVARIEEGLKSAGAHTLGWDASALQNGIYFYQFKAANQVLSGKVVLNK